MHISPFVAGLPKAEPHPRAGGTPEPESKFALAGRNGIALAHGTADQVRAPYDRASYASADPARIGGCIAESLRPVVDEGGADEARPAREALPARPSRNAVDISRASRGLEVRLRTEIDERLGGTR